MQNPAYFKILEKTDSNVADRIGLSSECPNARVERPNMTGEKGNERPLKDNICYGEGRRSVGARKAEKEGRKEREKRLIEKDSEMLTADRRQQGSETLQ